MSTNPKSFRVSIAIATSLLALVATGCARAPTAPPPPDVIGYYDIACPLPLPVPVDSVLARFCAPLNPKGKIP